MRTTYCSAPDCASYHSGHPNAGSHEVELRRWGWAWKGDGEARRYYCPTHVREFVPVPKPDPVKLYVSDPE